MVRGDRSIEPSAPEVWNNGKGLPIEMHKEHQCYVPELVFGHLLTSDNYDDPEKKAKITRVEGGDPVGTRFSAELALREPLRCKLRVI